MIRTLRLPLLLLLIAFVPGIVLADEHPMRDAPPATGVPDVGLGSLAWLAGGTWTGEAFGGTVEETWLPPRGGQMVGVFRSARAEDVGFYETMILLEVDGRLTLRLKHFTGELHGWEEKDETVDFPLVDHVDSVWYFRGLTIERHAADRMTIHVRVSRGDEESVLGFIYARDPGR